MVLFYTGTGNSEYVARRIAECTGDETLKLNGLIRSRDYSALHSDRPWVICSPTYCWQLPHIVRDWLVNTPFAGNRDIYFVLTCGDDIGNAGKYAKKLSEKIGKEFKGCVGIVMPENYIAMFNAPDRQSAERIISSSEPDIDAVIKKLKEGSAFSHKRSGLVDRIKSGIVNTVFYPLFLHSKKFTVNSECIGCGLCEKLCPLGSVTIENGRPKWHDPCTQCMACICHCPKEAIEYGKISEGKPRYTCPKSVKNK